MFGLQLWWKTAKIEQAQAQIKKLREKCPKCKGAGWIYVSSSGQSGSYGYSMQRIPCPYKFEDGRDCGWLEFDFKIGRSSLF